MEADRENDGEFDDDNKSKCGVTNAHDHSTNYISFYPENKVVLVPLPALFWWCIS